MSPTSERGGPTSQAGIYFQNCITVLRLVDMLTTKYVPAPDTGEVLSVRAEAPEEVDDTVVAWSSGCTEYIQAKLAIKPGSEPWRAMWRHFLAQSTDPSFDRERDRITLAVQWTPAMEDLETALERARTSELTTEWHDRLTMAHRRLLKGVQEVLGIDEEELLALCCCVQVWLLSYEGDPMKTDTFEMQVSQKLQGVVNPANSAFGVLLEMVGRDARVRGTWGYEDLVTYLAGRGIQVQVDPTAISLSESQPLEDLARMPSSLSPELFGRERELAQLDEAWASADTCLLSLVAFGGVGKTAIVNKWLLDMGADDYRGARRVFGWSFYSQGAAEGKQASADLFVDAALRWFGDPDPSAGSPWDKGQRLAELVRRQPTLLVLDGLEPLQYPPGEMEGKLKDPGLQVLLRALARHNPGLCVLTTRLPVADLAGFEDHSAMRIDLEQLSPEAGAQILQTQGVKGSQAELKQASEEFGGHALALTLLGSYLKAVHWGDIRRRDRIQRLLLERRQGGHARQVMRAYENWFEGKPELDILRLVGLFDRPVDPGAIEVLRAEPAIPGLTEAVVGLSHDEWYFALDALRTARLLAENDLEAPDTLDAHPLVREYFGERVRDENPEAWREAHSRLYEHYRDGTEDQPDTMDGLRPLYWAAAHGCAAGRYQEALDEVFYQRIVREREHFSTRKLGAFAANLAVLAGFFDPPWEQSVVELTEGAKAFVLNEAGFCLHALGRLGEAEGLLQAGLAARKAQEDWRNAAINASNLSELTLTRGDLQGAQRYAEESVELADRSGDTYARLYTRTTLADALHQAGVVRVAAELFEQAEAIQREWRPHQPLLYSQQGYRYMDLLLGQGKAEEVLERADQTLRLVLNEPSAPVLTVALEHLALGRAQLLRAQQVGSANVAEAADHLDQTLTGLRESGYQGELSLGLQARAELRLYTGDHAGARRDLDEALEIASWGGMRLHEADCHLGFARLYQAMGDIPLTWEHLAKAKAIVEQTGYGRRAGEVTELVEMLGEMKPDQTIAPSETYQLPDVLRPGLDVVFVGMAAGRRSAERREYYAGRGNKFWRVIHEVGFTPRQLAPDEFQLVLDYNIGLTDLNKTEAGMDREVSGHDPEGLRSKIWSYQPRVVAFNGKAAAAAFLGKRTQELGYGRQNCRMGSTEVWVLPSTSGAAGRWWDVSHWKDLARFLGR